MDARLVQAGSNRDTGHPELLGELSGAVAGERAGEEVPDFGGLGLEQHSQRGRIVAVAGPCGLEIIDGTRQRLLDDLGARDADVVAKPESESRDEKSESHQGQRSAHPGEKGAFRREVDARIIDGRPLPDRVARLGRQGGFVLDRRNNGWNSSAE